MNAVLYYFNPHTNFYIVWCCRTTTTEDESVDHVGDVKATRVNKSIWLDNSYKALSICTLLSALSALMSKVEVKSQVILVNRNICTE